MINSWSDLSPIPLASDAVESCAVPGGICYALQDNVVPDVRILCATTGCNYGGPIHQKCSQRWTSSCEMCCRMLSTHPGLVDAANTAAATDLLEGLFSMYRCPRCGQTTMCKTTANHRGVTIMVPDDPLASVTRAIQHVNDLLPTITKDNTGNSQVASAFPPASLGVKPPGLPAYPSALDPTVNDAVATVMDSGMHAFKPLPLTAMPRASWQMAWPNSSQNPQATSPTSFHQQANRQTQLLRRLSLRCGTNINSAGSSESTSGFGSSFDSSSRSSQSTAFSELSESYMADGSACWSASPGSNAPGSRAIRHTRSSKNSTGSEGFFTFDPMPPLQSNSPIPGDSTPDNTSRSVPTRQPLKHNSNNNIAVLAETRPATSETMKGMEHSVTAPPHHGRRHNSMSASGRGSSSSFWPGDLGKGKGGSDEASDRRQVVNRKGNIFQPRLDFNVFQQLPAHKRNAYSIQMDDDSCTGNEDTRAFLLAQLTNHRVSEVSCLACQKSLVIYDHFPVIDGIFFLSPICHRINKRPNGLRVTWHSNGIAPILYNTDGSGANTDVTDPKSKSEQYGKRLLESSKPVVPPPGCLGPRQQLSVGHFSEVNSHPMRHHGVHSARQERYLHALCMGCLRDAVPTDRGQSEASRSMKEGSSTGKICCRSCDRNWTGATLLVGGLYTYDVFAALPCCANHLTCNACSRRLDGDSNNNPNATDRENTQDSKSFNPPLPFFSQYSQLITCPFCSRVDYHFVKPFDKYYQFKLSA